MHRTDAPRAVEKATGENFAKDKTNNELDLSCYESPPCTYTHTCGKSSPSLGSKQVEALKFKIF